MKKFFTSIKKEFLLFSILFIGAFLRFYNLNWDVNMHLHPDERFLTMVGGAMSLPSSFSNYITPHLSTFNPANIGFPFFVYGIFPLTINKLFALVLHNDSYNLFTLQGRFLSAFLDVSVILLIFKTVELVEKKCNIDRRIKYFASLSYALFVFPIQLSHFFAVDTFLNFFLFASFYATLRYYLCKEKIMVIIAGIFFGFAFATKITALFYVPILLLLILLSSVSLHKNHASLKWTGLFFSLALFIGTSYFILRVSNPYIFENTNLLSLIPSKLFVQNIRTLKSWNNPQAWFPPGVQWINKEPIIFSFQNIIAAGIGMPQFILLSLGIFFLYRLRLKPAILVYVWVLLFFFYQSTQFVKLMRYFLFLYPFFAILCGAGYIFLIDRWKHAAVPTVIIIFIWPLMFFSIYIHPHTRIQASEWIYSNIPQGKTILWEHWDDPLPLSLTYGESKNYNTLQLPVFDPDTQKKWATMEELLQQADYYILSSNRGWGSIQATPERYPVMSGFYKKLFDENRGFVKIKEFTSYPSLAYLGIPFSLADDWLDESFSVYDHPKVLIYKKKITNQ